ncbi:hypothetical protein C8J56DRAFT_785222 [Mycena floridula]|nr:hypothetical protein C8J56DRAFT_785222 [Mycena floridula]
MLQLSLQQLPLEISSALERIKGLYLSSYQIKPNIYIYSVLVSGPYVLRTAQIQGSTLNFVGDLNGTTPIEIIAPAAVSHFT